MPLDSHGWRMALRRTLELLKRGERINDRLYRWTVDASANPERRAWATAPQRLDPWAKVRRPAPG